MMHLEVLMRDQGWLSDNDIKESGKKFIKLSAKALDIKSLKLSNAKKFLASIRKEEQCGEMIEHIYAIKKFCEYTQSDCKDKQAAGQWAGECPSRSRFLREKIRQDNLEQVVGDHRLSIFILKMNPSKKGILALQEQMCPSMDLYGFKK